MTHSTVEDSTSGLDQTLRPGRPLFGGGFSFHGVSGLCMNTVAHRLPGGIQAQGMKWRPMHAWVSCAGRRTTACGPNALVGDQCAQQRGPDFNHSPTTRTVTATVHFTLGTRRRSVMLHRSSVESALVKRPLGPSSGLQVP